MYEQLIKLMTLDRLVEMVGVDRLREMVDRQLAVANVLDALSGGGSVDPDLVRAALAALPSTRRDEEVQPETARPSGGTGDYLAGMDRLIKSLVVAPQHQEVRQPVKAGQLDPAQMHIGPNKIRFTNPPHPEGLCLASITDDIANDLEAKALRGLAWRERYILHEVDAWLRGEGTVTYTNETEWRAANSEERAQKEWVAQLAERVKSNPSPQTLYTMTLDFRYGEIPDHVPASMAEERAQATRYHLKVLGANAEQGWLLREVFWLGQTRLVAEHWSLIEVYKPPSDGFPMAFKPVEGEAPTAAQFIESARQRKDRWYVPILYAIQPVIGSLVQIQSRIWDH